MMRTFDEDPTEQMDRRALMAQMGRTKAPGVQAPEGAGSMRSADMQDHDFNGKDDRDERAPQSQEQPSQQPARDFSKFGSYTPQGVNMERASAGGTDPKDQIARVLSHFDPRQGITPEAVAALNQLGIGTFRSDARDKLYVEGEMDPRFKDVVSSDVINNFGGDNVSWNGWGGTSVDPVAQPGAAPMRGGAGGPSSFQGIQSLMPTDTGFFNTLQQRLQQILGGPQAMDRNALMQLLGR